MQPAKPARKAQEPQMARPSQYADGVSSAAARSNSAACIGASVRSAAQPWAWCPTALAWTAGHPRIRSSR